MVVKVYISGISGNKEVKKRQQRVQMILDSKHITYETIDITEPGKESEKDFMQNNSTSPGATISDTAPRHPLPPQLFNDEAYCGDYDQFDLANEIDTLEKFLKVEIPENGDSTAENDVQPAAPVVETTTQEATEKLIEQIASNGISSSREASIEAEPAVVQSNGDNEEIEQTQEVEETVVEVEGAVVVPQEEISPSEALIESEQTAASE